MIKQVLTQTEKQQLSDGLIRLNPIDKCIINHDWYSAREAYIIFSRKLNNGNICASLYVVDLLCLGVKNVGFIAELKAEDLENVFRKTFDRKISGIMVCDYSLVHHIIQNAKDFALKYGISPDENFKYISHMLDLATPRLENAPKIEFGQNGKPYLRLSKENENYHRYITQLERYAGPGNYYHTDFTYMAESAEFGGHLKHWNPTQWSNFIDRFDPDNYTDSFPAMDHLAKKIFKFEGASNLEDKIEHFFNTYEIGEDLSTENIESEDFPDYLIGKLTYAIELTSSGKLSEARALFNPEEMLNEVRPDRKIFEEREIIAYAHYKALSCILEKKILEAYLYSTILFRLPPNPSYIGHTIFSMINTDAIAKILDLIESAKTNADLKKSMISYAVRNS